MHRVLYQSIERHSILLGANIRYKINTFLKINIVLSVVSQGGKFVKAVLSIDDPNYPFSQGVKRMEVRCVARVYNKEEKRVSNTLYALCKMFSESHAPGIQTLTNICNENA